MAIEDEALDADRKASRARDGDLDAGLEFDDSEGDFDAGAAEADMQKAVEDLVLAEASSGVGGAIIVNDRFHISTGTKVPELNSPNAEAYACRDMSDPNHSVYALAVQGLLPPRGEDLLAFRRIDREGMVRPLEWGVTDWPGTDHRRFLIVCERPGGARLVNHFNEAFENFNEDRITRTVIRPMLPVLKDLAESHLTHRSFRLDNLFYKDIAMGDLMVGEGFSAPPAMYQPALFEPIESAMAEPGGRGPGSSRDDLYSFGVCLALMMLGRNPVADKTDEEIVEMKLRDGTYATILADTRVGLGMMEPLRGLLTDDPRERWSVSELELWLNGRRLSPKQPKLPPKAGRPFKFEDREYLTTPLLANALTKHWGNGTRAITTDPVDVWIRRGFEDEDLATAFNNAIRQAAAFGGRRGVEDRMLARACVVLDPQAPLRFRGLSTRIDGFPAAMMTRMVKTGDVRDLVEAINTKLPTFWLDTQEVQTPEQNILRRNFEMMSMMLGRPGLGFGVERCLYELNPSAPCLSPLIEKHYVLSIGQVLNALNVTAQERNLRGEPIDRHIAAFIAAKMKHPMDQHLQGLNSENNKALKRLSMIRLFADVQQYTGEDTPTYLAQWLARLATPIVESYRNRNFRQRLKREIKKIAERGTLMDLSYALENASRREKDVEGFKEAVEKFAKAEAEIIKIESGEMTKPELIQKKGQEMAAMVSAVMASLAVVGMILYIVVLG